MARALPILIIIGLAVYSFFDVLATPPQRLRRWSRTAWLPIALLPVVGATMWFLLGRPRHSRGAPGPLGNLRPPASRSAAPDDDAAFLRRLDQEAWRLRREQQRKSQDGSDGTTPPGVAPAG